MDASLRDVVHGAFGIRVDAATPMVGLGDECLLWHVTAPSPLVVRVAPAWREPAGLRWAYGFAARLAIPEAVIPLSGEIASWRGHPVTVWPFVPGTHLDRADPIQRDAAATLLARVHRAALSLPAMPPRPPDTRWPLAEPSTPADDLDDPALDAVVAAATGPLIPVHGDFYRRNVLWDDRITGLLDWDEARLDLAVVELAWSVWEFGKVGDDLPADRADRFLDVYAAAGGPAFDRELIVPLVRANLRREIRRGRRALAVGEYADQGYIDAGIRAFNGLARRQRQRDPDDGDAHGEQRGRR